MSISLPPPTEPLSADGQINDIWYRSLWQKMSDFDSRIANSPTLLASGSVSSVASLDLDLSSTVYRAFNVYLEVSGQLTTFDNLYCRYSSNAGVSFESGANYEIALHHNNNAGVSVAYASSATAANIVNSLTSIQVAHCYGTFYNPTVGFAPGAFWDGFSLDALGYINNFHSAGANRGMNEINGVSILFGASAIATAKYAVYGVP